MALLDSFTPNNDTTFTELYKGNEFLLKKTQTFHGTCLTPCFLWILSLTRAASVSSCPLSSFPPPPVPRSPSLTRCVGSDPSLAARERRGGGGRGGGRENGRLSLHGAPLTSQRYPGE